MRSRIVQLGAVPAINLTAAVTDVLLLDGGNGDPRMPRIRERALTILEMHHVDAALGVDPDPGTAGVDTAGQGSAAAMMSPGEVIDLPSDVAQFTVNVSWSAEAEQPPEVDVVAFELDTADRVLTDDEFVFYNQPASPDGAVRLTIDGSCEQGISIDLRQVPPDVVRIAVGAAIESQTFGDLGALSVSVDTEEAGIATSVLDAATTERSMIIAEIYRRGDVWRLRMIGQGYDDDLGAFAVRYGVEVDD